jgi:two-component system response regulator HydG
MADAILVVDDDASNREAFELVLSRAGFDVVNAADGRAALEKIRAGGVALVLTDLRMPGMNGIELIKAARLLDGDLEFIVMTAYGTVETAVDAMKEGAYDFVSKPIKRFELLPIVKKALERRALSVENRELRRLLAGSTSELIGQSARIREVMDEVAQVAPSQASILLSGESGTGKGLVARHIHRLSSRSEGRLVTLNCAAIPQALLESELFGHEAGAFTGAKGRREGRIDAAKRGTLFLDEITETDPAIQVKLLRVLQEGEYERVGGNQTLQADFRLISASNRDLAQAIASGTLREDLYYRLNVIHIELPPLRDRSDDIPLLAHHFLERFARINHKPLTGIESRAMDALHTWHWPGNVRELENVMERAVVLSRGEHIEFDNLPRALQEERGGKPVLSFRLGTPLKDVERTVIEETLRFADGDPNVAANLLGISARTIYRRAADWKDEEDPLED